MIGKEISHYKILERIGGGGMGVVYKAEDTKLKRPVALKFLPPAFATDSTTKERFIHEAQAASALQHNNICAIHEIDETDDGQMYIVMDCYEGETLKKKLENGKLDVDDAIDIIVQIAEGLKKAHAKGIIHRDTKPGNIIITEDGVAKILDFGLAKFRGQTKITKSGSTVGTVAYMSPEQARGEAVDHRTDIWSLGVILYEMVSGELPFKGDYDQAVVYSILNEKPESLNIEIPDALKTIIEKCLEKNPSDRYQDISYLLVDLKSTKDGSSTVHSGQQAKKIKLKPMVFTIAVLVFIVIGYLYIPFDIFIKTSDGAFEWENSIGILPFDNISNDPEQDYFCEGMTEQIISNLSRLPTLKVIARQSMMKYKDTDKTISEIGEELDVAYVLEGSFRKFEDRIRVTAQLISTKDDFHVWSEDYDREYTELLELQDDVSATIAGSLLKTISGNDREVFRQNRPKNLEAWDYYSRGKYNNDRIFNHITDQEYFNKTEEMLKKALEIDPEFAPSYAVLSDLYNTFGNYVAEGEEEKQKYLDLQEKYIEIGLKVDPRSGDLYCVKGHYLLSKDDLRGAYNSYVKSIKFEPHNDGGNSALGRFYNNRGLHFAAIKYLTRAIETNPLNYNAYDARASSYSRFGDLNQAIADAEKSIEIAPDWVTGLARYTGYLMASNRILEAEEMIKKIEKLIPNDKGINVGKSILHAYKGEKEKAFEYSPDGNYSMFLALKMADEILDELNKSVERHTNAEVSIYIELRNSRSYDFLRSDPRFQEILEKEKKIYDELLEKYPDIDL